MIIIKCDATDCKHNVNGECDGVAYPAGRFLNISLSHLSYGFRPICKDYSPDYEEEEYDI